MLKIHGKYINQRTFESLITYRDTSYGIKKAGHIGIRGKNTPKV